MPLLTVGVLRLEAFRFLHDHGQDDYLGLFLGGRVQQPVVPVGGHTKDPLGLQVHLLFVVRKLAGGISGFGVFQTQRR